MGRRFVNALKYNDKLLVVSRYYESLCRRGLVRQQSSKIALITSCVLQSVNS